MSKKRPQVVFATHNTHKLEEVTLLLADRFDVLSLTAIGCHDEIPETGVTLEENALIKARWVKQRYGYSCFADDTGLEVEALGGAPGVYSARYAGEEKSSEANMKKLLTELENRSHRRARFRTVIAWVDGQNEKLFEGVVEGVIVKEPQGENGFGYDPIFMPDAYNQTFAQLSAEEKNSISHRSRAVEQFVQSL